MQFREEAVCLLIPSLFFHSEYCWHSPLIISRTLPSLYSTSLPSQVPFSDNFSASLPPHLGLGSHTFTQLSLYVVAFSQSLGSKEFNCSLRCPIWKKIHMTRYNLCLHTEESCSSWDTPQKRYLQNRLNEQLNYFSTPQPRLSPYVAKKPLKIALVRLLFSPPNQLRLSRHLHFCTGVCKRNALRSQPLLRLEQGRLIGFFFSSTPLCSEREKNKAIPAEKLASRVLIKHPNQGISYGVLQMTYMSN